MTAVAVVVSWVGAALLLSALAPFRRPSLRRRLRPHLVSPEAVGPRDLRRRLAPLGLVVGDRIAALVRSTEPLDRRLRRVHHPLGPAAFRLRQFGHAALALGATGAVLAAAPLAVPPWAVALLTLGAPVAAFVGHEQALAELDRRQTRRVVRELPTVTEQLAMLLASGRSVSAALAELGRRGQGPCAADLRRVTGRIRQGVEEAEALREWAALRATPGVIHLVGVLTLAREATDLDHLVDQEAATIRADAHRELLAALERRSQQVWVPVTVATLLPGSLLLLVPFLDALRLYAGA